jgi:hypothetical protein
MRLATDKAGVLGYLLENEHHIELRDRNTRIHLRNPLGQILFVFGSKRSHRMINFPEWHISSLLNG